MRSAVRPRVDGNRIFISPAQHLRRILPFNSSCLCWHLRLISALIGQDIGRVALQSKLSVTKLGEDLLALLAFKTGLQVCHEIYPIRASTGYSIISHAQHCRRYERAAFVHLVNWLLYESYVFTFNKAGFVLLSTWQTYYLERKHTMRSPS